jgi:hypothetical protein
MLNLGVSFRGQELARVLLRTTVAASLALGCWLPTGLSHAAAPQVLLEAEAGTGGQVMPRSNASGQMTVWLRHWLPSATAVTRSFQLATPAWYSVKARYSDDGGGNDVAVAVNGVVIGRFTTQNTRVADQPPGSGWNNLVWTGSVGSTYLPAGTHQLAVTIGGPDGYGAEIDVVALDLMAVPPPAQLRLEAEAGSGDGRVVPRSNASGRETVWLRSGQSRILPFQLVAGARYGLTVRYSNDNFGPTETVTVRIDNVSVGQFDAADTGGQGYGWDQFRTSNLTGEIDLEAGSHQVVVSVSGGDGYGIEIDSVTLDRID